MQFLDKTKIRIISGRGGNGMVAWRREKYVDKGGPAGGDGGSGGDVYLIADENMSTLMDFKYKSVFKAESGENGSIKNMHGKCAKDLLIKVPVGTVVRDLKTGNAIADLIEHEQKVLVAKGGRSGSRERETLRNRGIKSFVSSDVQGDRHEHIQYGK